MFSIHRNHLSDQGVDYVTFGRGDKTLVIITGLSFSIFGRTTAVVRLHNS